jgi:hypothetical protein
MKFVILSVLSDFLFELMSQNHDDGGNDGIDDHEYSRILTEELV